MCHLAPVMPSRALWCLVFLAACSNAPTEPPPPQTPPIVDEEGRVPAIVCPGGDGCQTATGALSVGAATRVVTPKVETFEDTNDNGRWDFGETFDDVSGDGAYTPTWMAGFSTGRAATEVHDDLWARAIVFEQGELQVGIVVLDFVGWFHDDALRIRTAVREKGIVLDHLLVSSTHSHEGPDTMGPWGPQPGTSGRVAEYEDWVVAQAADAIEEAWGQRKTASMTYVQTDFPHLVADSRLPEVKDSVATALRFDGEAGTLATLVVWGNHPESMDDESVVTSDYPHYLRTDMEAAYPGAPSLFLAGNLGGLMNPLHITGCPDMDGNRGCDAGTFELTEYIGTGLARGLLEALQGPSAVKVEAPDLRARRKPIYVTPQNLLFFTGWTAGLFERSLFSPELKLVRRAQAEGVLWEDVQQGALLLETEVGSVGLGPIELVSVPGELYPELWMTGAQGESLITHPEGRDFPEAPAETPLSTLVPSPLIPVVVNQGNDSLGYIIPKPQFDQLDPRAYRDNGQYGEVNSVGPDIASVVAEGVRALYAK